jgi:hypothetical protein
MNDRLRALVALVALLVVDLLVLRDQIEVALAKAACLERARYELISCVNPPTEWSIAGAVAVAIGLAALIGRVASR